MLLTLFILSTLCMCVATNNSPICPQGPRGRRGPPGLCVPNDNNFFAYDKCVAKKSIRCYSFPPPEFQPFEAFFNSDTGQRQNFTYCCPAGIIKSGIMVPVIPSKQMSFDRNYMLTDSTVMQPCVTFTMCNILDTSGSSAHFIVNMTCCQ